MQPSVFITLTTTALLAFAGCQSSPTATDRAGVQEAHVHPARPASTTTPAAVATAAPTTPATPAATTEDTAVISARGMSCPLCASNADRGLRKLPGVTGVHVDLGTGRIVVGLDPSQPRPSEQQLSKAVEDAGFTPDSVSMPGEAE